MAGALAWLRALGGRLRQRLRPRGPVVDLSLPPVALEDAWVVSIASASLDDAQVVGCVEAAVAAGRLRLAGRLALLVGDDVEAPEGSALHRARRISRLRLVEGVSDDDDGGPRRPRRGRDRLRSAIDPEGHHHPRGRPGRR